MEDVFRRTELISMDKPITARLMVRTTGRNINYQQNQQVEEEEQPEQMQQDENEAENENEQEHEQPYMHYEAPDAGFQNNFGEQQQQGFQQINEALANMKIQQEKFYESMQNTQAQYLEELKALKTRQDELWSQQNHFYHTMRTLKKKWPKKSKRSRNTKSIKH
ncbi:hypothetical protein PIB30_087047 [Stylosanthes scabra]|uniref:Uncharacterized protein n=1 Tax=Stylosanthes scabra TaxID=79078 RepID=A0ABU6XR25_9FABA|nr:hypothetical protein [Stylosanthes scabra]